MTIHLNIGSNLGERESTLRYAADEIVRALPGAARISHPFESPAWGYESDNPYLNLGISITLTTPRDPIEILHTLRHIERTIDSRPHRDASGTYIDRAIDIDIIAIDDLIIDTPELILPHPRMHLREFVLIPMTETAPDWYHPILHLTPSQIMNKRQELQR